MCICNSCCHQFDIVVFAIMMVADVQVGLESLMPFIGALSKCQVQLAIGVLV